MRDLGGASLCASHFRRSKGGAEAGYSWGEMPKFRGKARCMGRPGVSALVSRPLSVVMRKTGRLCCRKMKHPPGGGCYQFTPSVTG